jgi:hypothetical protein
VDNVLHQFLDERRPIRGENGDLQLPHKLGEQLLQRKGLCTKNERC